MGIHLVSTAAADPFRQRLTFAIRQRSFAEWIAFLQSVAHVRIDIDAALDQAGLPAISFAPIDMELRHILPWIARLSGTRVQVRGRLVTFSPGPSAGEIFLDRDARRLRDDHGLDTTWEIAMSERQLRHRVTLAITETPLHDLSGFLGRLTGQTVVVGPDLASDPPVTLSASDMPLRDVLDRLPGLSWRLVDHAILLHRTSADATPAPADGF